MSKKPEQLFALLACAVVFLGTVEPANFEEVTVAQVAVAAGALVMLGLVLAERAGAKAVLAYVVAAGLTFRLSASAPLSSDVFRATAEALAAVGAGANPYTHYYVTTNPPGSPFVYLPGELAFYGIQSLFPGGLGLLDRWSGILIQVALAAFAPVCGWGIVAFASAFYAVDGVAIWRSLDGSNDTALALLVTLAVLLLAYAVAPVAANETRNAARLHAAGALVLGWGLAFKALSWPLAPFLVLFVAPARRLRFGLIALGAAAVMCLPFALLSPPAFFTAATRFDTLHANIWGFNLWSALISQHLAAPAQLDWLLRLRYAVPLLTLIALWRRAPALGGAVLQGVVVIAAALIVAPWSTSSYYVYAITLVLVAIASSGVRAEA